MSNFGVVKKVRSEKQLSSTEVINAIKGALGSNLTYEVLSESHNSLTVSGVEKGAPYKFEATFNVDVEGDKAKITVDGVHKITGTFITLLSICGIFCWMFLPLIGLIIGLIRLNTNKNMYTKKIEDILNNVEGQIAW